METHKPLLKDADEHLYRPMIESLMYVTSSRPDIMFAVCACARFQVNPKISHLYVVKRIFRYLKGQHKLGLWYPKDSPFDLVAFSDNDYAGASLDRKSTTRGCQFLGCRLISWQCKKYTMVANSKTEAEYIAASNCCGQRIIHKGMVDMQSNCCRVEIEVNMVTIGVTTAEENVDFAEIVDFLNANLIGYALTVSPTIYVSCIEQFWSTAKTKTVNNETQIHAKVEGKTIVISKLSVKRDLQFDDEDGTVTPLFSSMLAQQADMGEGSGQPTDPQHTSTSAQPFNEEPITVPSSSQPKKTHRPRKVKRATEISQSSGSIPLVTDEAVTMEREDRMERAATTASSLEAEQDSGNINRTQSMATLNEPSPQGTGSGSGPRCQDTILGDVEAQTRFETASKQSNNLPLSRVNTLGSGEDRLKLKELMDLYTKLSDRVLDLETTKTAQAKEIASLKKRVKKLERKRKSKTPGMNLFKIGTSRRRSLGEEDASKQGRNLKQGKQSSIFEESDFDDEGFDADMDEVFKDVEGDAEQVISAAADEVPTGDAVNTAGTEVNTASAPVTTAGVSVSTAEPITTASVNITTAEPITPPTTTTTIFEDEDLTIAQTLVKMRSEKSKVRGVVMQEPSETATRPTVPPQQHDPKDKGKGKMVKQEKPLKKKDQIKFDEEIAQRLQAQMQAELEEEERLAREREEDANIAEWDNAQAMMDADYELAARIQAQEQEELTIEEKSRLFVELMDKRKKHFARLRAEEQRRKPLTKAQKRNQMCTYLKNMAGFTHNQLKNKSFDEVQKAFDKTMSWIDSFVSMDYETVKGSKDRAEGSETRAEGSSKRAGEDLQQESTKKQKMDDDKEKEELKQCFEIIPGDEDDVTINATPYLADGKTQMYLTFSKMLKNFYREDLEVLWRIVKARFKKTGPVNYKTIPYYLLVEKMYPLTKHTLHQMFNNVKLQVDYECEMANELFRLVKKQLKEGYVPE
ncbi:hypothetical protein Tco_0651734 [Tanacetum coccineum]|uniref:Uncharacterized protein n=1 Tax=Tanacetum coccineum TaxID=301880 RepID=A0ABQ4WVN1_9ASTR